MYIWMIFDRPSRVDPYLRKCALAVSRLLRHLSFCDVVRLIRLHSRINFSADLLPERETAIPGYAATLLLADFIPLFDQPGVTWTTYLTRSSGHAKDCRV